MSAWIERENHYGEWRPTREEYHRALEKLAGITSPGEMALVNGRAMWESLRENGKL